MQSLFVEAVPGKRLTVFCGEKQEESKIWDIDLEDIRSIKSVHVCLFRYPYFGLSFDDLF